MPRPLGTVELAAEAPRLRSRSATRTDLGLVREHNEDASYVDPAGRFVIVADGMGGNKAGDVASAMAVDLVRTCLDGSVSEIVSYIAEPGAARRRRITALLDRAVRLANDAVVDRSVRELDKHEMGTTLEVVLILGAEAMIAHVGDSRTYLIRDGACTQVTVDHSVAELMRRAGTLTDDEARVSPQRSVLANAIGVTKEVTVEVERIDLRTGDRVLVCSDGLHDYFATEEIGTHLTGTTIEAGLDALVAGARDQGGHDNITGVVVEILEPEAVPVDPLDDQTTTPVSVPIEPIRPVLPLAELPDDAVSSIIEFALHESTNPE